jgi:hypothetical protein
MPPYYALWARLATFDPEDLSRLLVERAVVRATTMRGTIHLLTARGFRLVRPMLQPMLDRLLVANHRASVADLDTAAVAAAGRKLLDTSAMTAKDLGAALAERWPGHPVATLAMTVSCLEPLVQVPPRGLWGRSGPPSFATARAWLGDEPDPPDPADVVLRYLAAYGPASVRDMQAWAGITRLGPVFQRLAPDLAVFRDEAGVELFDLPDAPRPDASVAAPPRMLADFDSILLGHADRTRIITDEQRRRVFTINGQIRSTFTVDGFVHGIWRLAAGVVTFHPFAEVPARARTALAAEAECLLAFAAPGAGTTAVTFADPS